MDSNKIKIFNAFDLQSCLSEDSLNIQEMINYAEHRFQDILMIYGCADHNQQCLLQRGLHKERSLLCPHIPCGIHMESMSFQMEYILAGIPAILVIPIHLESIWNDVESMWIPCGIWSPPDSDANQ
jgi:hypothetical protein